MSDTGRLELPRELLDRAKPLAEQMGFDSVDGLVAHLLERVLEDSASDEDEDESEVLDRLRDLGYM